MCVEKIQLYRVGSGGQPGGAGYGGGNGGVFYRSQIGYNVVWQKWFKTNYLILTVALRL